MPIPDTPYTRKESYLNAIATGDSGGIPETPYTREEMYLDAIAKGGGGGGGGGSSTLSGLTDVDISNPTDGQTLVYNGASGKWENGAGGGVLVVGVNDQTMTLDKTWSELSAADFAVLITNDGSERSHYILGGTFVEEGSSTYYNAEFFSIYTLDGAAETNTLLFRAYSANDYPAFNNPA